MIWLLKEDIKRWEICSKGYLKDKPDTGDMQQDFLSEKAYKALEENKKELEKSLQRCHTLSIKLIIG